MNMNKRNLKELPDVLTIEDLRVFLMISRAVAYRLVKDKKIPSFKLYKSIRIYKKDLIKYILRTE